MPCRARARGRAAAKHLRELGLAVRSARAVRVEHVVGEQVEQRLHLVVVQVIAERRVQVFERDADREALELRHFSRHAPISRCSTITGFSCTPKPSIEISTGPATVWKFAVWIDLRVAPGLNAVPSEITSPGSSV